MVAPFRTSSLSSVLLAMLSCLPVTGQGNLIAHWGSQGYDTYIRNGMLEWTSAEWSGLNLELDKSLDMHDSVLIAFDYADLGTTAIVINLYDTKGGESKVIELSDFEDELVLGDKGLNRFEKKIYLPDIEGDANPSEISEVYIELTGSKEKRTIRLDNIRIGGFLLDFNLPDGSSIEEINNNRHAGWEPYAEGKDFRTKLMLHGMTGKEVQDLVPLARSWTRPAHMNLEGNAFEFKGYDPAQMAYVIEQKSTPATSVEFVMEATKESPLVNPASVIKNWGNQDMALSVNHEKMKNGEDYRVGFINRLEGTDLVLWVETSSSEKTSFSIIPVGQTITRP
jgi:hypothetical protein